jgi:hypothetical protein
MLAGPGLSLIRTVFAQILAENSADVETQFRVQARTNSTMNLFSMRRSAIYDDRGASQKNPVVDWLANSSAMTRERQLKARP